MGPATVLLQLGADQTTLTVGGDGMAPAVHDLPLGTQRTAQQFFARGLPGEYAMETAIAAVEDLVMPLHRLLPAGATLQGDGAVLHEIAHAAGLASAPGLRLGIDDVERVFNRLANVATGSTAAQQGIPASTGFAAGLLILRELMHHLHFDALTLR